MCDVCAASQCRSVCAACAGCAVDTNIELVCMINGTWHSRLHTDREKCRQGRGASTPHGAAGLAC